MLQNCLVFFEFPDEVDCYFRHLPASATEDTVFVALNPKTQAYLKRLGIFAQTSLGYFDNAFHEKAIQKVGQISDWLWKEPWFKNLREFRFSFHESVIWHLRSACSEFIWLIEILHSALEQNKPKTLRVCSPKNPKVFGYLIWPPERYLGILAKRVGRTFGLSVEFIGDLEPEIGSKAWKESEKGVVKFWLKNVVGPLIAPLYGIHLRFKPKNPVVFTTPQYRMKDLANSLTNHQVGESVWIVDDWKQPWKRKRGRVVEMLKREIALLNDAIRHEPDLFSWRDVFFQDLLGIKLMLGIRPYLIHLHQRAETMRWFFKTIRPKAIISCGSRNDDIFTGEICKKMGIKGVMLSHGSFVKPKNEWEKYEWGEQGLRLICAPFPYTALQSPLAEDFLKEFPSNGAKPIRTGPLVWGGSVNKEKSRNLYHQWLDSTAEKNIVLYANTPKGRGAHRFFVYETQEEFLQSLIDLSNAILEIPNTLFVIKFRPTYDMDAGDLKTLLPQRKHILISEKEPLLDVLGLANLLVSFSSTVIEEALQNKIPVLLYGGGGRYQHIEAPVIDSEGPQEPSAIYHVKEASHLSGAIQKILTLHQNLPNGEALFQPYCYKKEDCVSLSDLISR